MFFRLNPSSGVPLYLQLMEQVKHAIETGALRPGEQLPAIRTLAQGLVMNANTVARAYRELEHEGVLELRQGSGAFISASVPGQSKRMRQAQALFQSVVERLASLGVTEQEMRRAFENELCVLRSESLAGRKQ